ncbi:hypothetical protein LSAT2_009230 [Lamellibrachia satsuma]|nr:hypothetical protein LSAT2_009230 [Lamellibrachia satsuma]
MSWRIDVETRARHADQVSTPTAIVELQIASNKQPQKDAEVVRFEMDENTLAKTLESLKDIDSVIAKHCHQ